MAWCLTGDMPLPEPMMAQFNDKYICVIPLSPNELMLEEIGFLGEMGYMTGKPTRRSRKATDSRNVLNMGTPGISRN